MMLVTETTPVLPVGGRDIESDQSEIIRYYMELIGNLWKLIRKTGNYFR